MTNFTKHILTVTAALFLLAGCTLAAVTTAPAGHSKKHKTGSKNSTAAVQKAGVRTLRPISHNDSLRFKLYYFQAVQQQIQGNLDAAYDLFAHCRDINPDAAEVWFMLSYYDIVFRGDTAALADIKVAADLAPDNNDYLERLANGYLKVGDSDNAVKTYERLAANNPGRAELLDVLTQLYDQRKDYDGMLRTISRIEALEGSSEQTVLAKMRVYAMRGEKDKELAELQGLSARHPNDMNFKVMTGNWLLQNNRQQEALREYTAALEQEPENASARMSMIDYYRSTGDSLRADSVQTSLLTSPKTPLDNKLAIIRQAVADNERQGGDSTKVLSLFRKILSVPQETTDMKELYVAYMTLKKMPQDSIDAVLEDILIQSPDNTSTRIALIQSEWSRKNFTRVEELCRQALDYNPEVLAFYYFLSFALVQQEKDSEALLTLRKGISLDTDEGNKDLRSDCFALMGDLYHDAGRKLQAYAAYDSCLQIKDDNFPCLNNYAYYLSLEGQQLAKAEQMSLKTVQAEPDNSTYLDTYAWILFKRKKYSEAAEYIDMAIENDTDKSAVLFEHGGDIYAQNGNINKALEYWQEALKRSTGDTKILKRKIKQKKYIDEK